VAQVIECLSSKTEALNSNPSNNTKKKKKVHANILPNVNFLPNLKYMYEYSGMSSEVWKMKISCNAQTLCGWAV
jgi:hypothetical protein